MVGKKHPFKGKEMLSRMSKYLVEFLKREEGPTAVEYAVMLALIIVVCLVAITAIGLAASGTFNNMANQIPSSS